MRSEVKSKIYNAKSKPSTKLSALINLIRQSLILISSLRLKFITNAKSGLYVFIKLLIDWMIAGFLKYFALASTGIGFKSFNMYPYIYDIKNPVISIKYRQLRVMFSY